MLSGREAMVKPLFVVNEKRRGLFFIEWAKPGPFPSLFAKLYPAPNDIRHGHPCPQLIKKVRGQAHSTVSAEG
jgi:hypothetical protein